MVHSGNKHLREPYFIVFNISKYQSNLKEFISETFVIKQPFEISGTLHLQTLTDKIW